MNRFQILGFLLICYAILLMMTGCEDKKEPAPKPPVETKPIDYTKPTGMCNEIQNDRYTVQLQRLVCELKKSEHNPDLKSIVLAQWILESGWGKSGLAVNHLNYAGLKWRKEMTAYGLPVAYDAHDGKVEYIKFRSQEDFINGYWAFIARYPYKGWEKYENDPEGYLRFIVKAGYCPDNGYVDKVLSLHAEAKKLLELI